jgi:NAD(P)-dependent dehydrogenase (short-subunit alcohol dehydrogenase family)
MEGQFDRKDKTTNHPHINMAKAALNMMMRTSAADYAEANIFMNSVDTGWITNENPYPKAHKVTRAIMKICRYLEMGSMSDRGTE